MKQISTRDARQRAFEQLAFPQMNGMFRLAMHLTHDRADAEDLTQEAFLRAYAHFDRFRRGTNFRAWIFRILRNLTINQSKRRQVRGIQVDIEVAEAELEQREPDFSRHDLCTALRRLSNDQRTAVWLCFVEGFTYAEIAEVMGTPAGTVMSRLHRARRRLRAELTRGIREPRRAPEVRVPSVTAPICSAVT